MSTQARQEFLESLRPGQMLETLFESLNDAYYFVKDRDSRFVTASRGFALLMGIDSVAGLVGKTDHDFSPDFLVEAFIADDKRVIQTGQPIRNKMELVPTADGTLDWLFTTKVPLYDQSGNVAGLAGVVRVIRDNDKVYAEHPAMQAIIDFVRTHFKQEISVADMAAVGGISVSSQERLFKASSGLTPLMYLRRTRLNAACKLLRETDMEISEIAQVCGFSEHTNMTRAFRMELKITPLRYRKRFSEAPRRRGRRSERILFG